MTDNPTNNPNDIDSDIKQGMCGITLFSKTGISDDNYPAFDGMGNNKDGVDNWFDKYKAATFNHMSITYPTPDGIHSGAGSFHIPVEFDKCINMEYVRITNGIGRRTWYGTINNIIQVNANSTRISFQIDWVATYWDQLSLGVCNQMRRSEKNADKVFTNNLYDGFNVTQYPLNLNLSSISDYPYQSLSDLILNVVYGGDISQVAYSIVTDCDKEGHFDNPYIEWQNGSMVGGALWETTSDDELLEYLKSLQTFGIKFMRHGTPMLSLVKYCYVRPRKMSYHMDDGDKKKPFYPLGKKYFTVRPFQSAKELRDYYQSTHQIDKYPDYQLQNDKLLNYVDYAFIGQQGSFRINPRELPQYDKMNIHLRGYGSPEGNLQLYVYPRGTSDGTGTSTLGSKMCQTGNWPTLYIAGSINDQWNNNSFVGNILNTIEVMGNSAVGNSRPESNREGGLSL